MRRIIKIAALALMPLVLGGHARAAENEGKVITLSCAGTLTPTYGANKPEAPQSLQKTALAGRAGTLRSRHRVLAHNAASRTWRRISLTIANPTGLHGRAVH
jgi:hypothetical protein